MRKMYFLVVLMLLFCITGYAQSTNYLVNGGFENELVNWRSWIGAPAAGTVEVESANPISGTKSAKIVLNTRGAEVWQGQFDQRLTIHKGVPMRLKFKAKASQATTINLEVAMDYAPYTASLYQADVALGTTVQEYTYTFTPTFSDANTKMNFLFGRAAAGTTIWLDDLVIEQTEGTWDGNIIANGEFDEALATSADPVANGGWKGNVGEGDQMTFTVDETTKLSGPKSMLVNVASAVGTGLRANGSLVNYFEAKAGQNFELTFDVVASKALTFKVGMNEQPLTDGVADFFLQDVQATTTKQTVTVRTTRPTGRHEMHQLFFAGFPEGTDYKIWIDNVKLKRLLPCEPSATTAYHQVDKTGGWNQGITTATLNPGQHIKIGPHPNVATGWSWTGPNGFTATTREIVPGGEDGVAAADAGQYVGTYTNTCGATSTVTFTLNVNGANPDPDPNVCYTPLYETSQNLTPDPQMTDRALWGGWGNVTVETGEGAYCGTTYAKLSAPDGGCRAALDVANFAWQPETTYRLHVWVKTIGGSIGFLAKGSVDNGAGDYGFAVDTEGQWMLVDRTFTTSATPTTGFFSFNTCDFGSTATEVHIDNYELYVQPAGTEPTVPVNVAYVTSNKVMAEGASDPILAMLQADPNLNVTVHSVPGDATVDLSGADVIVAQEGFGSGDAIWKPAGSLALASLPAPTIYNKTYALRNTRAVVAGGGTSAEAAGLSITVPADKQALDLYKGITFTDNAFPVFLSTANDVGAEGTKSFNYTHTLTLSADNTLVGTVAEITAPATTVFLNVIPQGTTIGDQVTSAKIIMMGMNIGAISKGGNNMTAEGLTLWRNAVYHLAGLPVPNTLVGQTPASNVATLSGIMIGDQALAGFDAATKTYNVTLPAGTTTAAVSATVTDNNATTSGTGDVDVSSGTGTATIVVTAEDGTTQETYTINFTVEEPASNVATLSGITLSAGTINFDPATKTYNVQLPAGTSSVTVNATKTDENAAATGTGDVDVSSGSGTATIIVTAEDGIATETYTINFTVEPSSVAGLVAQGVNVYPNPVNGNGVLHLDRAADIVSVKVYTAQGVLVKSISAENIDTISINVADLADGLYLLKAVKTDRSVLSGKFVK